MASASASNQYAYQKPSTLATRSLVTGDKPKETASASSQDAGVQDKPTLQRRTTNNYAEAVAAANNQSQSSPSSTANSDAARPGLDRQQSWKMQDLKREHAEKMLNGQMPGGNLGYSTAQK